MVVAAGALATTTAGVANGFGAGDRTVVPLSGTTDLAAALVASQAPVSSGHVRTVHDVTPAREAAHLVQVEQIQAQFHVARALQVAQEGYNARQETLRQEQAREAARQAQLAAEEAARRPKCVRPAEGSFTSGFGARWGTTHMGVDIANRIGTPILSAMNGVVVEAGPASGFGLWVRVQHDDGTITVYGHVDRIIAQKGTKVTAGDQIATMGNRGQSTGPHLHFEVWTGGSQKVNPVAWLAERGVKL